MLFAFPRVIYYYFPKKTLKYLPFDDGDRSFRRLARQMATRSAVSGHRTAADQHVVGNLCKRLVTWKENRMIKLFYLG